MTPAVYDMAAQPVTYDILVSIAIAGALAGEDPVEFVILADKLRNATPKDMALTAEQKMARVHRMLLPCCDLLPTTAGARVVTDPAEAAEWRRTPAIRSTTLIKAAVYVAHHGGNVLRLRSKKPSPFPGSVVITLRNSPAVPEKNCDTEAWLSAATEIASRGHKVVLVPDTAMADDPLPDGFTWCREAAKDVGTRAALYEHALCSLSMGMGPMTIPMFMRGTRYAVFVNHRNVGPEQRPLFEHICGIPWGSQLPFAQPGQVIEYRRDTPEAIVEAFERATEAKEAA